MLPVSDRCRGPASVGGPRSASPARRVDRGASWEQHRRPVACSSGRCGAWSGFSLRGHTSSPNENVPPARHRYADLGRAWARYFFSLSRGRSTGHSHRNPVVQVAARRCCRETYLPTKQPQASPQARFPCPYRHPRRPRRSPFPPGQGASSSQRVITSIARRRTFSELRRDGRRVRHGSVRLNFLPLETTRPQVAFAIGRSFGNAVERNRGRRRLKAAFIQALDHRGTPTPAATFDPLGGAFLLTGSRGLLTERFTTLVEDVEACLDKLDRASTKTQM